METILEQQRRYHEEKERLMDVMAKEMLTKKSTVSLAWAGASICGWAPSPCVTSESSLILGPSLHLPHPHLYPRTLLVSLFELWLW